MDPLGLLSGEIEVNGNGDLAPLEQTLAYEGILRAYEGSSRMRNAEFGMHCWDAKAGKVVKRTGVGVKWTRSEPGCILFAPGEAQLAQGPFSRVKRSG